MEQLSWSDGSKALRSRKEDNPMLSRPETAPETAPETGDNQENEGANQQRDGDIMGQQAIFRQPNTSREDANDKISEREMIGQTCQNPFFTKTSYVEDLEVQQNFLMPRSSHEQSNSIK